MEGEETRGEWMEVLRVSWVKNGQVGESNKERERVIET